MSVNIVSEVFVVSCFNSSSIQHDVYFFQIMVPFGGKMDDEVRYASGCGYLVMDS